MNIHTDDFMNAYNAYSLCTYLLYTQSKHRRANTAFSTQALSFIVSLPGILTSNHTFLHRCVTDCDLLLRLPHGTCHYCASTIQYDTTVPSMPNQDD